VINCQKCGRLNEDRYKFCLGCGAPLAQVATPEEQSGAPPIPAASFLPHGRNPIARPLARCTRGSPRRRLSCPINHTTRHRRRPLA
jgi:hypothetical protein